MDEPLLLERAALWRSRADQATDPRDRDAFAEIAERYEDMARVLKAVGDGASSRIDD